MRNLKTFLGALIVLSIGQLALANSICELQLAQLGSSEKTELAKLRSEFEAKLDPSAEVNRKLGWGSYEGSVVTSLKQKMLNEKNYYDMMFLPAKFEFDKITEFEKLADNEGKPEVLRFFGEMLRLMDQKQMADQQKKIFEIAGDVSLGAGFLNMLRETVTAGKYDFKWSMSGGKFKVGITPAKPINNFGW